MERVLPDDFDIEGTLIGVVDQVVIAVSSLRTVDADLMSLLHLDARRIFNVGVGDPLYADVDARRKQCSQKAP